jgi:hypothetical protein
MLRCWIVPKRALRLSNFIQGWAKVDHHQIRCGSDQPDADAPSTPAGTTLIMC